MLFFVTVLHIVLCVVLCLIIILQPGKGGDVASAFGGGGAGSASAARSSSGLCMDESGLLFVTGIFLTVGILHTERE